MLGRVKGKRRKGSLVTRWMDLVTVAVGAPLEELTD